MGSPTDRSAHFHPTSGASAVLSVRIGCERSAGGGTRRWRRLVTGLGRLTRTRRNRRRTLLAAKSHPAPRAARPARWPCRRKASGRGGYTRRGGGRGRPRGLRSSLGGSRTSHSREFRRQLRAARRAARRVVLLAVMRHSLHDVRSRLPATAAPRGRWVMRSSPTSGQAVAGPKRAWPVPSAAPLPRGGGQFGPRAKMCKRFCLRKGAPKPAHTDATGCVTSLDLALGSGGVEPTRARSTRERQASPRARHFGVLHLATRQVAFTLA